MNDSTEENTPNSLYVIRFLNTQLAGCDYQISEQRMYYFVGTVEEMQQAQELLVSPSSVFVPDDKLSQRFEIEVEDEQFNLISHAEGETKRQALTRQKVESFNGIYFALRTSEDDTWSSQIEEFNLANLNSGSEVQPEKEKKSKWPFLIFAAALVLVVTASLALYLNNKEERDIDQLRILLGGDKNNYRIHKGSNGHWYIFAQDIAAKEWAIRSLQKSGGMHKRNVINVKEEASRLANEMQTRWPNTQFHLIRFDSPERPELVLSKERSGLKTEQEYNNLRKSLLDLAPYAEAITFSSISDKVVARHAEEGLIKTATTYKRKKTDNSLTFISRGSLQDNELNTLKNFMSSFRQEWQGNYVRFEIEIEKNWLKGKSFQYGADGYVKMNPSHWYFPSNIEK